MSVLLLKEIHANCRRSRQIAWDPGKKQIYCKIWQKLQFPADLTKERKIRGGLIGYVKSKPLGNGQIISIDVLVDVMIIAVFHKKLIWPPVRALSKLKRHLLDLTLWTTVLRETTVIDRWRHMCFYWKRRWKQMWRHLSIAVAALKTVVQRVRSNRWRFNFEMAIRTPL